MGALFVYAHPMYVCSGLKTPLATLWPGVKHYE
jgi:hypothetical protein